MQQSKLYEVMLWTRNAPKPHGLLGSGKCFRWNVICLRARWLSPKNWSRNKPGLFPPNHTTYLPTTFYVLLTNPPITSLLLFFLPVFQFLSALGFSLYLFLIYTLLPRTGLSFYCHQDNDTQFKQITLYSKHMKIMPRVLMCVYVVCPVMTIVLRCIIVLVHALSLSGLLVCVRVCVCDHIQRQPLLLWLNC